MTEVLTAVSPAWEAQVATTLERVPGVTIARRCVDVAELLSVAEAGLGDVAVVSVDLRDLDLGVVNRLQHRRVRVLGLHPADDESGERRLRQLGVDAVVRLDASADELAAVVVDRTEPNPPWGAGTRHVDPPVERELGVATGTLPTGSDTASWSVTSDGQQADRAVASAEPPQVGSVSGPADGGSSQRVRGRQPDVRSEDESHSTDVPRARDGQRGSRRPPDRVPVVAVWGPTGSPGRTTIATTLAAELAHRAVDVLLVDADTYGGSVAQALGVLDEAPGVAAACRAADLGTLDVAALAGLAPQVMSGLRVLTGLPRADRWPEVRAAALERVLELSRRLVEIVVVDCGFCLEDDEELSYDTLAPRRNEATLTSLAASDVVIAVSGADPAGLQRYVRGIQQLGTVPSGRPVPVVNRVRASAVGNRPEARIADSLRRFAGVEVAQFVPDDQATVDAAMLAGRSVVEQAPGSKVRAAVSDLATTVAPWTMPAPGRQDRQSRRRRTRRLWPTAGGSGRSSRRAAAPPASGEVPRGGVPRVGVPGGEVPDGEVPDGERPGPGSGKPSRSRRSRSLRARTGS